MRVERASWVDVGWIVGELPAFCQMHNAWEFYPGPKKAREMLAGFVETQYLTVAYDWVKPVGFLLAIVGAHALNPELRTASEALWWAPSNPRAGLLLLDEFVKWGKENVDYMTFSLVDAAGERALARRGLVYGERVYQWSRP